MTDNIIFYYLKKYWLYFLLAALAVMLSSAATLSVGKIIGYSVAGIYQKKSLTDIFIILFTGILLLSIGVLLRIISISYGGGKVINSIRKDLYRKVIHGSIYNINQHFDQINNILITDITILQNFFASSISIFLRNFFTLVGSLIMLFYTSTELSLYTMLIIPAVLLTIVIIGKKVKFYAKQSRDSINNITSSLSDTLNNIKAIKSFTAEKSFIDKFDTNIEISSSAFIKHSISRAILVSIIITLIFTAIAIIILIGINNIYIDRITATTLSEFIFYSLLIASSTNAITDIYGDLQQVSVINSRLKDIYDFKTEQGDSNPKHVVKKFSSITFENVNFSYPGNKNLPIIENVNFTINAGETVAIVGPSGAGKSTIFNLLLGFYKIDSGKILINETDINNIKLDEIRRLFALVLQEPTLFASSILENIKIGNPDANFKEIINACKVAHVLEFTQNLPEKLNTAINKIREFSRGQQQRIAIARAILKDAPIILFDEATSSLDAESERLIQDSIQDLQQKKAIIIIAHRLSTIKNANKTILLKDGKVNAIGSHKQLTETSPLYKNLADLQLLHE